MFNQQYTGIQCRTLQYNSVLYNILQYPFNHLKCVRTHSFQLMNINSGRSSFQDIGPSDLFKFKMYQSLSSYKAKRRLFISYIASYTSILHQMAPTISPDNNFPSETVISAAMAPPKVAQTNKFAFEGSAI